MAYADYNFYLNSYIGDSISEADFPKFAERASEQIDSITYNRITSELETAYALRIQKACCAVADYLHDINSYKENITTRQNVVSETVGGISKTYANPTSIIEKAVNDVNAQNVEIYNIIKLHLGTTGLMSRCVEAFILR